MSKRKGKRMQKVWAYLFDTHIENCEMIAVCDRCLRRWKREIVAGQRPALIVRVAQEMDTTVVVAERTIDAFLSDRKDYLKR